MEKLLGNKKVILLFVMPAMLVYFVFYLAPIIANTALSFTKWDLTQSPVWIGFTNYAALFKDAVFKTGLKNIAILVFLVLAVQLPISLLLALFLAKLTRGVRFIKTSYFIPVVFSATAVGLVWLRMFDSTYGVINELLRLFGSEYQQKWLSSPNQAIWAITFPMIWCKTGYYLILFYAAIKAIPLDYYQAALIDGCTGVRATFKITIPLLRNNICMCAVLCAIGAIKEYPLIYVMTLGGPFKSTFTPAMEMYTKAFLEFNFGYGCALGVVLVVFSLLVYKLIHWLIPTQDIQY